MTGVACLVWAWLVGCVAIWALLHATFHLWGRGWGLEPVDRAPADVRICVPARDEAGRIGRCVAAALATGAAEVVVIDDGSTDGTAAEAASHVDARLTVRPADPRPEGWAGKPWACACAANGATTRWLLFVDADVVLDPRAPTAAIQRASADGAAMLSLFGSWELGSFWERVAIPAIGWFIRGVLDLDAINRGTGVGPLGAFANGQFILVDRAAYDGFGGHGAVRAEVLDDVRIAARGRAAGVKLRLLWAPWAFRVRLYEDLAGIVQGYRKNLHEGTGRSKVAAIVGAAIVLATTVGPPLGAVGLALAGWWLAAGVATAICLALVGFRWRLERRDGRSGAVAVLHPLAGAVLAYVLLVSMRPRATWKGRAFVGGQAGRPRA
jgi:chlorobactene glucosyltransferase